MKQDGAEGAGVEAGEGGGLTKRDMKAEHEIEGEQEAINYLGSHGLLVSCSYQRWGGTRTFSSPLQELSKGRIPDKLHTQSLFSLSHLENHRASQRS